MVIVDNVPPAPSGDLRGKIRLYIPQRIRIDGGEEQTFTLRVLEGVFPGLFLHFDSMIRIEHGETTAPGWVTLDKAVIEESRGKNPADCKKMVEPMEVAASSIGAQDVPSHCGKRLSSTSGATSTRAIISWRLPKCLLTCQGKPIADTPTLSR